ncbi:MAG: NAD(P)/FAD-dependent oxidoreductase [Bryobacteraceae bacterium]|nr:NAD(P)/FAD-dependent oxidoreductase [Bryobacteraceae bacterium]
MAAAVAAAESGARVAILDDNPAPGGQIWRLQSNRWTTRMRASGAEFLAGAAIYGTAGTHRLRVLRGGEAQELAYAKLILATGARERFLPFPGWTQPHVLGVGGLQALAKGGLPIAGKRIVVAGTGPLLLAVAAYLQSHGAIVPLVAEQASNLHLLLFGLGLGVSKLQEAGHLFWDLRRVPYRRGTWVTRALPGSVELNHGDPVACDYLACGFGLVPNLELATLLGCEIRKGAVAVDEYCQTSREDVLAAGEINGIGGEDLALVEGQLAGYVASGQKTKSARWLLERKSLLGFRRLLARSFVPRRELRYLAAPETIVCRCEDVTYAELQKASDERDAKLQSRCGMGACQGRVCGTANEFLFGWPAGTLRTPLSPVPLSALAKW